MRPLPALPRDLRPTALQRWVAGVVAVCVAFGISGSLYQRYYEAQYHQRLTADFNDYEFSRLLLIDEYIEGPGGTQVGEFNYIPREEVDALLDHARESHGLDVVAVRQWKATILSANTERQLTFDSFTFGDGFYSAVVAYDGVDLAATGRLTSGRAPESSGEIALSWTVARDLGVSIGDTVALVGTEQDTTAQFTVVGLTWGDHSWSFLHSWYLGSRSWGPAAVVWWGDAARLNASLESRISYPYMDVYWNGDGSVLGPIISEGAYHNKLPNTHAQLGWRYFGVASLVSWVFCLTLLVTARRRSAVESRGELPWGSTIVAGVAGSLVGLALGVALSWGVHSAFGWAYPDIWQPSFGLPSVVDIATWFGIGVAAALMASLAWRAVGWRWSRAIPGSIRRLGSRAVSRVKRNPIARAIRRRVINGWTLTGLILVVFVLASWRLIAIGRDASQEPWYSLLGITFTLLVVLSMRWFWLLLRRHGTPTPIVALTVISYFAMARFFHVQSQSAQSAGRISYELGGPSFDFQTPAQTGNDVLVVGLPLLVAVLASVLLFPVVREQGSVPSNVNSLSLALRRQWGAVVAGMTGALVAELTIGAVAGFAQADDLVTGISEAGEVTFAEREPLEWLVGYLEAGLPGCVMIAVSMLLVTFGIVVVGERLARPN